MKFPFYSNYKIDDSDIGCHRVIYADCDGVHKYKSVCELMKECQQDPQLKKQCIVDFLNSDLKTKAGQFLKIDNRGCLTAASPDLCPCEDVKVWATKNDKNPGPLIDKLIGWCDATGTYCISVGTPNPWQVQVLPSGPINWFTQFKGSPDCDDAYVKMDRNGNVFTECPELKRAPRYAYAVHSWGTVTLPWNITARIPAAANGTSSHQYNFSWRWDIFGTEGFKRDTEDGVILIEEPGIYFFSYSSYVYYNPANVHAIRAGLRVDNHELCDFKYNWPHMSRPELAEDNNMYWYYPQKLAKDKWWGMCLDLTGVSFSWSYMFPLFNASKANPARLKFFVKPDLRVREERIVELGRPVTLHLTDSTADFWPKTVITVMKVEDKSIFNTLNTL